MEMKRCSPPRLAIMALVLASANAIAFCQGSPAAAYDEAVAASSSADPAARSGAAASFAEAALGFEAEASRDYRAWYDAGTARAAAGDAAAAVLDFRRYLARDYFSREAWDNLAAARKRAGTAAPGGEGAGSWPWALWLAAGASLLCGAGILALGLFLLLRKKAFLRGAVAILCAGLALGGASGLSYAFRRPIAVLLRESQGRMGDADAYAAQPAAPWKAGQEAWVIGERGGWLRIKVGSELSWLPAEVLEVLR